MADSFEDHQFTSETAGQWADDVWQGHRRRALVETGHADWLEEDDD